MTQMCGTPSRSDTKAIICPSGDCAGLWSAAGHAREPRQYEPFIERMLYWFIAMDAAFVFDAWLMTR